MRKLTIRLILLVVICIILGGCSTNKVSNQHEDKDIKLFNSGEDAINYNIKADPSIKEIIGETKDVNNEKLLIYRFQRGKEEGFGTASLVIKDLKVMWVFNNNRVVLKQGNLTNNLKTTIKSYKGQKYDLYIGYTKNKNKTVETKFDTAMKPHLNNKIGIYYLIVPYIK